MEKMTGKKYETIIVETDEQGIALLTFNRPEVRNALNQAMVSELHDALDDLAARDDVRVLIFTGAGEKAFMSGADIGELRDRKGPDALGAINSGLFLKVEKFPSPTIAAIRGYALGGGCELSMACDIRICSELSKMGQPEVGIGIIPGAGGIYRMPRLIGLGRAKELIFTGRIIDAREALEMGLANRVVPDESVLGVARELAGQIARNSPLAVRLAKQLMLQVVPTTNEVMKKESELQALCFDDPEKHDRMTAFLEKRKLRREGSS